MEVIASTADVAATARLADFIELTKPRITLLVLVTAAVGYAIGVRGTLDPAVFLALLVGTALVAGGASALNQYWERAADGRMQRTKSRPLPSGRVAPAEALRFGVVISAAGLALLVSVNALTAVLGAGALASYVLLYTPLKRVTSLCTVVGAVPGAIPPVMGWAAARGSLEPAAWGLFIVLFLWQLPHFLAIGWLYREDYARGGFPMLTVADSDGRATGRQVILYCTALLPATLMAGVLSSAGPGYLWGAVTLGLLFLACSARFAWTRSLAAARGLFLASVLYLPALLGRPDRAPALPL
ncbi:MAG TPA: heme o synthase [Thermoanaerobaculia bacterium]|nr:heme o synthase [Thermoanaerobaculia bacterium]